LLQDSNHTKPKRIVRNRAWNLWRWKTNLLYAPSAILLLLKCWNLKTTSGVQINEIRKLCSMDDHLPLLCG